MEDAQLPPPRSVYRAMGRGSAWERIGAGVMDKAGIAIDHPDYDARTYSLIYVLRGRGSYRDASGRSWRLAPGDCFQRRPGHVHTTELDPSSRWLEAWIDLGPGLFRALADMRVLRVAPTAWHWGLSPGRVARFTALIGELERAGERELPELCVRCQALVVEAQRVTSVGERPADDPIDRACRLLADEAATRLDLRSFCRRERLDYEIFRKDFRQRLGMPPAQYRIRRRLERACVLLHTTGRSIADIADELGYHSPYEFSSQFRARLGVPPSVYRAH